jgi:acyl dehydratase
VSVSTEEDDLLYWEDMDPGSSWRFGSYPVTSAEIVEFAERYDPLPMHIDPERARETPLGIFCASGVHTLGMTQKLLCDDLYRRTALIAGGEIRDFLMRQPVVPGDVLSVHAQVEARSGHRRRQDAGWVEIHAETLRVDGTKVMEFTARILFARRDKLAT